MEKKFAKATEADLNKQMTPAERRKFDKEYNRLMKEPNPELDKLMEALAPRRPLTAKDFTLRVNYTGGVYGKGNRS